MSTLICAFNKKNATDLQTKLSLASDPTRTWSVEQNEIFGWFATGFGNAVVDALAGTGKTTTILEGARRAPESADGINVSTLHSLGLRSIKKFRPSVRVLNGSERADWLAKSVCGISAPDAIVRLVSKLNVKAREITPHAKSGNELTNLAIQFECEPDEQWDGTAFNLTYVCAKTADALELAANDQSRGIDFSDMIFLPVRHGWMTKSADLGIIDEAQDMTVAQLELFTGSVRGRIVIVGDPNQAIYGFRGADCDSMSRLSNELDAARFGLTTTYRCGKVIVNYVSENYVPHYRADKLNPLGLIDSIPEDKLVNEAGPGNFILSRTNAPLVSIAMTLLRNGKRTRIAGRDIGAGLKALIRKLSTGRAATSIPQFLVRLSAWESKEITRLNAKFAGKDLSTNATYLARRDGILDQAEMLRELASTAESVNDLTVRIDALFTDDGLGEDGVITCSSVHRSKGMEAKRVFVLRSTLRETSPEERNIAYVAVTRAIHTLTWVGDVRQA